MQLPTQFMNLNQPLLYWFVALSRFIWLNLHFLIFKFQVIGALTADKMRWSWICIVLKLITRHPLFPISCLRYTHQYCTWSLELNKVPGYTTIASGNKYMSWYWLDVTGYYTCYIYHLMLWGEGTFTYLNKEGISHKDWCIC